jgi:hypothetical protein
VPCRPSVVHHHPRRRKCTQRPYGSQILPGARRCPALPWLPSLYAASSAPWSAPLARVRQRASLKSFEHAQRLRTRPKNTRPPHYHCHHYHRQTAIRHRHHSTLPRPECSACDHICALTTHSDTRCTPPPPSPHAQRGRYTPLSAQRSAEPPDPTHLLTHTQHHEVVEIRQ